MSFLMNLESREGWTTFNFQQCFDSKYEIFTNSWWCDSYLIFWKMNDMFQRWFLNNIALTMLIAHPYYSNGADSEVEIFLLIFVGRDWVPGADSNQLFSLSWKCWWLCGSFAFWLKRLFFDRQNHSRSISLIFQFRFVLDLKPLPESINELLLISR